MPIRKLSQKSFVNGQYDRAAQNQEAFTSASVVSSGLSYAKNVLSSDKGELRKRLGTKYLRELSGASVVIPFRLPNNNDAIFVCDNGQIAAYKYNDNGEFTEFLVASGDAPTFPHGSGWDASNINGDYTVTCSSSISTSAMGKGFDSDAWHAAHPYTPKPQMGTQYSTSTPADVNVPAWVVIESATPQILGSVYFTWLNTCEGDHQGHYKGWLDPVLQYSDNGTDWTTVQTGVYQADTTRTPGVSYTNRVWRDEIGPGMYQVKTDNKVSNWIENIDHLEPHSYWRIYFRDRIINTTTYGTERLEFFVYNVTYVSTTQTAYTNTFEIENLKDIKYAQNDQTMFIASKGNKPIKILYQNGTFQKSTFTTIDTYGTPTCVEYFQNRLWFGGLSTMPNGVIASKFNAHETFTPSSPVQADDTMELKCNQLESEITNIKGGQKVLYCFSDDGISNVDGGGNGWNATSVQNIEFILRNRMPAGNATPAFKDDVMLYASSDGTKLYGVDYDLLVERFQVKDLAIYAKDVTKEKVTELHYLNNEAKLVYGLTEQSHMFALLYEKGAYQGFYPLDFNGDVYDIAPIKSGRNYKLLMVVNRNGRWYLEEKLDLGEYIDTSKPRMTADEKKWATYDNLENNIALDCYQTYDESFNASVVINNSVAETTDDLSAYIGKSVMFGLVNDPKSWCIATIDDTDDNGYAITIEATRGNATSFDIIYPEITSFIPNLPQGSDIKAIAEGRYFNNLTVDENGYINMPLPCYRITYGINYEALAILKVQAPYESMKTVVQVDVSVIDTTHLEIGTDFADTQSIEKIDDSSYYDLTRITMNDSYRVVLSDTPEMTKNIILRSNKGVPFTVNAIETYINYSNLGGD